jgi:hypothetical protein
MRYSSRILCLVVGVLFGFSSLAQEKFASYENSYVGKFYPIQITSKDNEKFTLYIDAFSLDATHELGGININEKNYQGFIDALNDSKVKYEEWVKTAKDNNVNQLDKQMPFKSRADAYFLYGSKWNFQFDFNLTYDFRILDVKGETKYLLLVKTGELKSSSNQFMKVRGVTLIFESSKEIDTFLSFISKDKIDQFINKPKKEALFN